MILLFWADIKGVFGSKYIVYYYFCGCILYAAVADRFLVNDGFSVMIVFVVDTIIFSFVSITRSKFEFCFLVFVVNGAVTYFKSSVFALVWLVVLFIFSNGLTFGSHR